MSYWKDQPTDYVRIRTVQLRVANGSKPGLSFFIYLYIRLKFPISHHHNEPFHIYNCSSEACLWQVNGQPKHRPNSKSCSGNEQSGTKFRTGRTQQSIECRKHYYKVSLMYIARRRRCWKLPQYTIFFISKRSEWMIICRSIRFCGNPPLPWPESPHVLKQAMVWLLIKSWCTNIVSASDGNWQTFGQGEWRPICLPFIPFRNKIRIEKPDDWCAEIEQVAQRRCRFWMSTHFPGEKMSYHEVMEFLWRASVMDRRLKR